ncbi:MAG: 2,3-bisphosphoglycerate-independent phosphoglycerate mutase [Candidatus Doudnabacteria bacterium CG10_big_fil_rev_8_21_14_0_10_41_10]|uniref:2,3-bisphosphoglycerate-independent phosphoglycerate mutase n=1 Tax=Candidatus Doudnabacteria bacterium CG10_big_fil_rev_8_21_14_0_10_41_10 TaxID=1974551 RepID=A0A2H0VE46_9BACT|nr:MAG: 2,3-bisphosphoglycerate-independent phosphoglycerate mutase [Candidatus Doudnabacteria bacterium CG10_big_fil_rev_8_21_14_0_10_41_10]
MDNQIKRNLVVLTVLDGWGIAPPGPGNVISLAKVPNFDNFLKNYPNSRLTASGKDVGLKENEPGNSEAGHENMGAGRTVLQDKIEITKSILDGTFFKNAAFVEALNHAKKYESKIHLMGLLSDERSGHAEPEHLEALLVMLKQANFNNVYLHLFTDGRDTPPKSAEKFLKRLHLTISSLGVGKVATISGRYYGMDRAHNYQRLEKSYNAIVHGKGKTAVNEYQAVKQAYERGETDEFITPTVIPHKDKKGVKKPVTVGDDDAMIFFNLRSDRARQMTKAFVQPELLKNGSDGITNGFKEFKNLFFVSMTEFGTDLPVIIAYPTRKVFNNLPQYLEKQSNVHQLYISESEKFAHVSYFFHGNYAKLLRNEKKIRIDSKNVATFDLAPEMSANEIVDTLVMHLRQKLYNFCLVNFPNADMLGHTGDIKSAVKGVEVIDSALEKIYEQVKSQNGSMIITADHGNVEEMIDLVTKEPTHEHSRNLIPFIVVDEKLKEQKVSLRDGSLRDVAPTVLDLMQIKKPDEMLGISLLKK